MSYGSHKWTPVTSTPFKVGDRCKRTALNSQKFPLGTVVTITDVLEDRFACIKTNIENVYTHIDPEWWTKIEDTE